MPRVDVVFMGRGRRDIAGSVRLGVGGGAVGRMMLRGSVLLGSVVLRNRMRTAAVLLGARRYGPGARTQENKPWAIVNVDWAGDFSTYSPELLGLSSLRHGNFALGNVANDRLEDVMATKRFRLLEAEVGVEVGKGRLVSARF